MKIFSWFTTPPGIGRNSFYGRFLQIWRWLVYLPSCPHDQYRPCFHYQFIRQKAGKVGQHLTCTCRFGPTLLCPLLLSSHRPVYTMADGLNSFLGWADIKAWVHLHFQLLLSHLLSRIWKSWRQRVAGSPFTSLSSHLQLHSPTCLCWHRGKEWSSPLVVSAALGVLVRIQGWGAILI